MLGIIGTSLLLSRPWRRTALTSQQRSEATRKTRQNSKPAEAPTPGTEAKKDDSQLATLVLNSLDDAKAEEVVEIELAGKTSIADDMIIATGRSSTHVGAIADRVIRNCKEAGFKPRVEGLANCDWVLIDIGDVILHLFRPEVRQFYNLEKMWGGDRPVENPQAAHSGR